MDYKSALKQLQGQEVIHIQEDLAKRLKLSPRDGKTVLEFLLRRANGNSVQRQYRELNARFVKIDGVWTIKQVGAIVHGRAAALEETTHFSFANPYTWMVLFRKGSIDQEGCHWTEPKGKFQHTLMQANSDVQHDTYWCYVDDQLLEMALLSVECRNKVTETCKGMSLVEYFTHIPASIDTRKWLLECMSSVMYENLTGVKVDSGFSPTDIPFVKDGQLYPSKLRPGNMFVSMDVLWMVVFNTEVNIRGSESVNCRFVAARMVDIGGT